MLDECLVEALIDDEILFAKIAAVQDGCNNHIHFFLTHMVKEKNHQVGKKRTKIQIINVTNHK